MAISTSWMIEHIGSLVCKKCSNDSSVNWGKSFMIHSTIVDPSDIWLQFHIGNCLEQVAISTVWVITRTYYCYNYWYCCQVYSYTSMSKLPWFCILCRFGGKHCKWFSPRCLVQVQWSSLRPTQLPLMCVELVASPSGVSMMVWRMCGLQLCCGISVVKSICPIWSWPLWTYCHPSHHHLSGTSGEQLHQLGNRVYLCVYSH